jgi:hypothetical protein
VTLAATLLLASGPPFLACAPPHSNNRMSAAARARER